MCGVIGYVGEGTTPDFFYQGLRRLEYRGYDSAGIAMVEGDGVTVVRAEGKLSALEAKLDRLPARSRAGIGHTRWATHGKPSEENAHPHRSGPIVLLHNGIIENYLPLKQMLVGNGFTFLSETDTEVAAHLLHLEYRSLDKSKPAFERMKTALSRTIGQLKGAYAFAILCLDTPDVLYAVKYGSPLVLGRGEGANYLASGTAALVDHTREVMMMDDGDVAFLRPEGIELTNRETGPKDVSFFTVSWSSGMLEKGHYSHFMQKEIYEQPQAVAQTLSGRIDRERSSVNLQAFGVSGIDLGVVERVQLIACGTSFYASTLARYFIERATKVPVEVDLASEYRYRALTADRKTLTVAISQSGETIDTLFAVRAARAAGAQTLAVVNAQGSSIAHACHAESLIHAGPEIGVASTKAFSAQVASLFLLGLALGEARGSLDAAARSAVIDELVKVPSLVEQTLALSPACEALAAKHCQSQTLIYIGRGPQWPVAMEGALKLKELSYIYAEAYAAGELKHGPIALIDPKMTVVAIAPRDSYYEKTLNNIAEIKARGGRILGIGTAGDAELESLCDDFIGVPAAAELIQPFVTTVPIHLLAYWVAVKKGTDVDQPRNLAKSVTVE